MTPCAPALLRSCPPALLPSCALALLLLLPAPARAQDACPAGPLALVLSGGGARGIAHVGLIQTLDSLGVRPDLIVGTSMGAIVGALRASGYTGRQLDSISTHFPVEDLFRQDDPRIPHGWRPLVPIVVWEEGERGFSLQSAGVSEAETSALLNALLLRGNLLARGDFDSLAIPFRAVATDLATQQPVLLGTGDLAQAVRASSAIPLVYTPVRRGEQVLTDGGLSANLPAAAARRLGATRLIVSDVRSPLLSADQLGSTLAVADQLAGFLFQQASDSLGPFDVLVRPDVGAVSNLNFEPAVLRQLIRKGREAADSVLDTATCLVPSLPGPPPALPTTTGEVRSGDLTAAEARTIARILRLETGDPLDTDDLRPRLSELADLEPFREVWLTPTGADTVDFNLQVVRAPRRVAGLALAYDNELGGRAGVAGLERQVFSTGFEATGVVTLGRYVKDIRAGVRRYAGATRFRLTPVVEGRYARLGIRQFDSSGVQLPEVPVDEWSLRAGLEQELRGGWTLTAGLDLRDWHSDPDTRSGPGLRLAARRAARTGLTVLGDATFGAQWDRVEGEVGWTITSSRLTLTPKFRAGWGDSLPPQLEFAFGGYTGFPGLHLEELRGDREVLGSLQAAYRLNGTISVRLLLSAGRIARGGELIPLSDGDWLGGVRPGIGAATPLGPIYAEFGVATNGRTAVLVRVGEWF